ncbi:stage V sporulation protein AA [Pullulanibacillus sp. KACC 23026]|uniref:stage V sporulation protein AA n=1 Tax=Pullulanibacillus sp. KACC 23026 TaxID=3028315 RepID=UPI0023AFA4B7|nr:stage V sporulation protein AA [Pullulanibacillus sp. KACC 23026]WEG11444.1 stage V sporulation protein AA [Pullulanibacillus sp. KACC 23026]
MIWADNIHNKGTEVMDVTESTVYLRLRYKLMASSNERLTINRLAKVIAPKQVADAIQEIHIQTIQPEDSSHLVIDAIDVIKAIHHYFPELDIQTVGPAQTIIEVASNKKKRVRPFFIALVWLLLFIGAALTIMNFHEDVAMGDVHKRIYTLMTGDHKENPLIIQIPYSIGVGVGMVLFFNHLFKKKFNEEPSPLEVEMFNYQQNLDQFVIFQEKMKKEQEEHD